MERRTQAVKKFGTLSHSAVLRLAHSGAPEAEGLVLRYLEDLAFEYSLNEVLAVITLVDTPDVFD